MSLAVAILASNGCVLPPPIGDVPDDQPPRIEPTSLSPHPTDGPVLMTTKCDSYVFLANVTDPDLDDIIYWRVFLDYHRDPRRLDTEVRLAEPDLVDPRKPRPIEFHVNPSDPRFVDNGRLAETHTVELLIADRPFYADERELEARAVQANGLTDSFIWPPVTLSSVDECRMGGVK